MKTTTKKDGLASDAYFDLVRECPLKPIRNAAEHEVALAVARRLMLRPEGAKRDAGERDYLDVLTGLIDAYERKTMPTPNVTPQDRLRYVLTESGTSQAALSKILGLSQPATSLIMNGKRSLTIDAVKRLAEHFRLSAAYFI